MHFNDYDRFEKNVIKSIQKIINNNLKSFIYYKKYNLNPAIERQLYSIIIRNKNYFFKKVLYGEHIWNDLENLRFRKIFMIPFHRELFFLIKFIKQILNEIRNFFLFYKLRKKVTDKIVVLNHPKFLEFFIQNKFLNNNVTWICTNNYKDIKSILPNTEIVLPLKRSWKYPSQNPVIGSLLDIFFDIENFIIEYRPKLVISIEGDAQFHSLLSVICNKFEIKNICLQWGVFYENGREIRFSNMEFSYFLTWGKFFTKQLEKLNPKTKFVEFGYPLEVNSESINIKKNKILCIGESISQHVTNDIYSDYIDLIIQIKKNIPNLEIIYRPHPSHKLNYFEDYLTRYGITIRNNYAIKDELSNSLICLAISSSSLAEALLLNAIPISFNMSSKKLSIPFREQSLGLESDDKYFLLEKIKHLIKYEHYREPFIRSITSKKNYYFHPRKSNKLLEFIDKI